MEDFDDVSHVHRIRSRRQPMTAQSILQEKGKARFAFKGTFQPPCGMIPCGIIPWHMKSIPTFNDRLSYKKKLIS